MAAPRRRPPFTARLAPRLAALLLAACGGEPPAAPATGPSDPAAFATALERAARLQDGGGAEREALEALLAEHALDPAHGGVNHRLGRAYSDAKLHEKALEHFEAAFRADPADHETLLSIVTLRVRLDLLDAALADLPRLLDDPRYAGEARYQKALVLDRQGRREEAEALARDTADLPDVLAYRCRSLHGRYLFEQGRWEEAAAEFARALAGRADYKEALRGAADCARRLGREDEARRWDEVLALFVRLTDNVFLQSPRHAAERRAVLEQVVATYPEWSKGFQELADLQAAQGERAAACATLRAWLQRHGGHLSAAEGTAMEARYCGKNP
jgi:tetratricopeptide (TPR) repeat protein